mmetsp:Transcript_40418/g.74820  ORF Transcript_40418/g.74820 Transcript_40418/m.74820 type:complete len:133 (-) Transcript_40418:75-473(-)
MKRVGFGLARPHLGSFIYAIWTLGLGSLVGCRINTPEVLPQRRGGKMRADDLIFGDGFDTCRMKLSSCECICLHSMNCRLELSSSTSTASSQEASNQSRTTGSNWVLALGKGRCPLRNLKKQRTVKADGAFT